LAVYRGHISDTLVWSVVLLRVPTAFAPQVVTAILGYGPLIGLHPSVCLQVTLVRVGKRGNGIPTATTY
jgi:hypothetical protein